MNRQWLYAKPPAGKIAADIGLFEGNNRGERAVRVS